MRLLKIALLSSALGLTACDMFDMPGKMDDMNKKMNAMTNSTGKLGDLSHLQALDTSWKELMDSANTKVPDNPAPMADKAKVFADQATALDLVEFMKAKLLEIRNTSPDDSSKVHGTQPADLVDQLQHDARAKLTGLQAIMMFADQSKVEQMVNDQVPRPGVAGGLYEQWVYPALMLRAMGIWGYLWTADLHDTMDNMGNFREAVRLADEVDYIVHLPFASKIGLNLSMPDGSQVNYSLSDPNMVNILEFWTEIQTAVTTPAFVAAVPPANKAEYSVMKARVDKKVLTYQQEKKP